MVLKEFPEYKRGQVERIYKNFAKDKKKLVNDYITFRVGEGSRAEKKNKDLRRFLIQFLHINRNDIQNFNENDLIEFLKALNSSKYGTHHRQGFKDFVKSFLRFYFSNADTRFNFKKHKGLCEADIKRLSKNKRPINPDTIPTPEEVEIMINKYPYLYFKTMIAIAYEGGLRTVEVRTIKKDKITFNDDGICRIEVYSPKTQESRSIYLKKSVKLLKSLLHEQKLKGTDSIYLFSSPIKKDVPISHTWVCNEIKTHSKKVLGRELWFYLLRHARATILYKLSEEGKISESVVSRFMGHSKNMKDTYLHLDDTAVYKMLKEQIFEYETEPITEGKESLRDLIEAQNKKIDSMQQELNKMITQRVVEYIEHSLDKGIVFFGGEDLPKSP